MLQPDGLLHGVHQAVHPRHAAVVGAVKPGQPQDRAFHRHRGVAAGHVHDGLPGDPGQVTRRADHRGIEPEFRALGCHASTFPSRRARTCTRRLVSPPVSEKQVDPDVL